MNIADADNMTDEELTVQMIAQAKQNIGENPELRTSLDVIDYVKAVYPVMRSLFGGEIPLQQQRRRLYVCSTCPVITLIQDKPSCGVCGCILKPANTSAINLVIRPEDDYYGCKFEGGSRWKEAGV